MKVRFVHGGIQGRSVALTNTETIYDCLIQGQLGYTVIGIYISIQ